MNCQLVEKLIKLNNEQCPEFVFTNPLLDRHVASALSKSYIKILKLTNQNLHSNNNIRHSVLKNIRKMSKIEPENHYQCDENITSLLSCYYLKHINQIMSADTIDKTLDAFLIRKLLNTNSNHKSVLNPEIIQALVNINENDKIENLSKTLIHWNMTDKHLKILKDLWTNDDFDINDKSIKMKSEIECTIISFCHNLLLNRDGDLNLERMFTTSTLKELVKRCSISAFCFQICYTIINYVLVNTNFDCIIQTFIQIFVNKVKIQCTHSTFSVLYPCNLGHLVVLLDFDINELQNNLKIKYIEKTLNYLYTLHNNCESDLILLLSHFPQWFDIYFKNQPCDQDFKICINNNN